MTRYEYKVRPAPSKGRKGAGIKGAEAKFANGLEHLMNEMGSEGWEYVRSDILPSEERQGLTSSQTVYRSVLVFRRSLENELSAMTASIPQLDSAADAAELPQEVVDDVENSLEHTTIDTDSDVIEESRNSVKPDDTDDTEEIEDPTRNPRNLRPF